MIDRAVAAIEAGQPVVLPTDTVYGLCADPEERAAAQEVYRLKGRQARQPTALLARDVEALLERLPELRGPVEGRLRALLPGPCTLVVPNPASPLPVARRRAAARDRRPRARPRRAGRRGARPGRSRARDERQPRGRTRSRAASTTSPRRSALGCGALVDGGELPGTPSTVLDLTGPEPRVLRDGAVPAAEAIERALAATSRTRE